MPGRDLGLVMQYTGENMSKQLGMVVVGLVLIAVIVTLLVSNFSLRGDIEALTDALSRPSQSEEEFKAKNAELARQLTQLQEEVARLKARAEPLERLAVNHTARITELVNQIKAYEAQAKTEAAATETTVTGTSAEVAAATTTQPDTNSNVGAGVQHVLKRGETLQQLAGRYYNDQTAWRRILDANKDVVKNTRSMLPGITLFIPDPL